MRTLRYTGGRSGPDGIWVLGHGSIFVGDEVEVNDVTAAKWLMPSAKGKCDFELAEESVAAVAAPVGPSERKPRKRREEPVATAPAKQRKEK